MSVKNLCQFNGATLNNIGSGSQIAVASEHLPPLELIKHDTLPKLRTAAVIDPENLFANSELTESLSQKRIQLSALKPSSSTHYDILSRQDDLILLTDSTSYSVPDICICYRLLGGTAPIIVLNCRKEDTFIERVISFGADDVLPSGADSMELIARIERLLSYDQVCFQFEVKEGDLLLMPHLKQIKFGESTTNLSEMECIVLGFLMAYAGSPISGPELFAKLWSKDIRSSPAAVRVHVNALRRKLSMIGATWVLRTVPRRGYMYFSQGNTKPAPRTCD